MLQLHQFWTILEGKYSPVHDVIVPRPISRYQIQKNTFYLNGFFVIFCPITIQKPFWRNLSMLFGLWWKMKKWDRKMCFFDHSFVHIFFCFPFCRKTHAWIPRKYDVLSNCFKIQLLHLSLEEKSTFFAAPEVMTEFSAAWCLSIVGQAPKATCILTESTQYN